MAANSEMYPNVNLPGFRKRKRSDDEILSFGFETVISLHICPKDLPFIRAVQGTFYDEMISITVGTTPDRKEFHIHRGLLRHFSDYFRTALDGQFKEALEGRFDLHEDSVDVFQAFHNLIYTNRLYDDTQTLPHRTIFEIIVFSDVRGIPALHNAAMNALIFKVAHEWKLANGKYLTWIYDNTATNSPLRKFWVDFYANTPMPRGSRIQDFLRNADVQRNSTFFTDLVIALKTKLDRHEPSSWVNEAEFASKIDNCKYHVHKTV